jgi:hypothetical protein
MASDLAFRVATSFTREHPGMGILLRAAIVSMWIDVEVDNHVPWLKNA